MIHFCRQRKCAVGGAAIARTSLACVKATTEHANAKVANGVNCGMILSGSANMECLSQPVGRSLYWCCHNCVGSLRIRMLENVLLLAHKAGSNIRMFALFWASKIKVKTAYEINSLFSDGMLIVHNLTNQYI